MIDAPSITGYTFGETFQFERGSFVKKLILPVFAVLFLAGCGSEEEKAAAYTEQQVEKLYGVEAETVKIEEQHGYGSTIVVVLAALFGDTYDLSLKSEDDLTFSASITGDLTQFNVDYVTKKHESLMKKEKEYQKLVSVLEENGISQLTLTQGFEATIEASGIMKTETAKSGEIMDALTKMCDMIIMDVPYSLALNLETENPGEPIVSLPYKQKEHSELTGVLEKQLQAFRLHHRFEESVKNELNTLGLTGTSFLDERTAENEEMYYEQSISLSFLESYQEENLLKAMELIRQNGMNDAQVSIFFQAGSRTESCKASVLKNAADLRRCFGIENE